MLLSANVMFGQKTWLETTDGSEFAPDKEIKIYININNCDCQRLLGATEVYLWTWNPSADDSRTADNKNGEWTKAINIAPINSRGSDLTPKLSPDEKYLYFASNRHPDIKIEMKNEDVEVYKIPLIHIEQFLRH